MNKSLLLLCFLPFALNFSKNYDFSNNNVNDDGKYTTQNNFSIGTWESTLGTFHSYTIDTGLKVLISGNDLKNDVSKYKHFKMSDELSIFYHDYNGQKQDLLNSNNNVFLTTQYLVDEQTKTKEFYVEGWDGAGYYQAYVKYNFSLNLSTNSLYFSVTVHVYGGWCVTVLDIYAKVKCNAEDLFLFF